MNIDKDLFERALSKSVFEGKIFREKPNERTINFLDKYEIPNELKELLIQNSFNTTIKIGNIFYYQVNKIEQENLEEQNCNCINEKLLIVGFGLSGDPIVVDINTFTMGFVFHDELWESSSINAREVYIDTGLSFGQFYFNALTQSDSFPVDGYEAEKIFKA